MRFFSPPPAAAGSAGFSPPGLLAAGKRRLSLASVVGSYKTAAMGKKGVVLVSTVAEALSLAEEFRSEGIPAAALLGKASASERKRLLEEFRGGGIAQLVLTKTFLDGIDLAGVEVVILTSRFVSGPTFHSVIGSPCIAEGGVVIDLAGNIEAYGVPQ